MNEKGNLRPINEIERGMIYDSLSQIASINHFKPYQLCVLFKNQDSKFNFPSIYLVPYELVKLTSTIKNQANIVAAGIYFGFIKKGRFSLSIEGAEFLYKSDLIYEKVKLKVNKKGEKAILYGNKLLKGFVSQVSPEFKKNDILIVFNNSDELLSLVQAQLNYDVYKNCSSNDIVAYSLVDKGYYLRKNQ